DETGGLSRAAERQYTVEDPQEHQGVRGSRAVVARGGDEPARRAALLRPFEDLASGVLDRPRRTRFFREPLPGRIPRAIYPELFRTRRDPALCADRRLQGDRLSLQFRPSRPRVELPVRFELCRVRGPEPARAGCAFACRAVER